MMEEKIDTVKAWPKPKSVRDIQIFLGFSNFYWHFIPSFSKIAVPITSILKTNSQPTDTSPVTSIDDSKVVGRNNKKSTKSDFIKLMRSMKEFSFLTSNAR